MMRPNRFVTTSRIAPIQRGENRRDGQLDRVGYGDVRKLKHKQMPRLD